ncbi:MAG TPA: glycine betaine ABC transporter substrate-binding protein [Jatrophihabitantaceae bacterium]|jgi:osmoprotectant transport system substrate-binding protein|nr:glycine betaine ABC transporter substrate-binding protein [Jatrophihabitantaceae bacterium]
MNRNALTVGAAVTAAALIVAACGSDSAKKSGSTSGAGASGTIASKLILGGPAEFQTRPDGIPGLTKIYGVTFKAYKVTDTGGPLTVTALKNGQVDAADLFTTDPAIKANNFVVLEDPRSDFGAQNVLPLINKSKATDGVKTVLNLISSKLTTQVLIDLRTKVEVNKEDPDKAAQEWLGTLGLPSTKPAAGVTLKVGSANFPENVVLADVYADALRGAGATVSTKLNIGSREKYIPALEDGSIDLIPEYSGVLLQYFSKGAPATTSDAVYAALKGAVPAKLMVLDQSSAQDADAIVVTAATAQKYNLKSIADLAKTG